MAYVLIVDDDEEFARVVATVLRLDGHEVETLFETTAVIESLSRRCPDLLVLDVMFPESDTAGFTLARQIRDQPEPVRSLPILLLTAINQRFPLGFGRQDIEEDWMPVTDFLEKPVDIDVLHARMEGIVRTGGKGREEDMEDAGPPAPGSHT